MADEGHQEFHYHVQKRFSAEGLGFKGSGSQPEKPQDKTLNPKP